MHPIKTPTQYYKFRVILGYIVTLRLAWGTLSHKQTNHGGWAIWDSVSLVNMVAI